MQQQDETKLLYNHFKYFQHYHRRAHINLIMKTKTESSVVKTVQLCLTDKITLPKDMHFVVRAYDYESHSI